MDESKSDESYFLKESPTEVERLIYQHDVAKDSMQGKLVLAPVDLSRAGLRILDSATADGYWLRDLQKDLVEPYTLVGTDIVSSYFPSPAPPCTTLLVQSITKPWPEELHNSFDLVHQRLALPGSRGYPMTDVVKALIRLVKPGGWIQLIEADHSHKLNKGTAVQDSFDLIRELFGKMGVTFEYAPMLKGWLEEAGMVDVHERIIDMPMGKANPNPELAKKGAISLAMATQGLVEVGKAKCSLPSERLDVLPREVERDLRNVGGYHRLFIVWGRKPVTESERV